MALRDLLVRFSVQVDQKPLEDAQRNVDRLTDSFKALAAAAKTFAVIFAVREIMEFSDAATNLQNRLKAVTETSEEMAHAQKGVFAIARETFASVEDVAASYQRYKQSTDKLNLSQDETLDLTKRITQATILGGATQAESAGAMVQLGQAIARNFKGSAQEIRSIQAGAPMIAKIIAKAVGGSVGDLATLAKEGKISSKIVVDAIRNAGTELDAQMAKRTQTFGNVASRFRTEGLALMLQLQPATKALTDQFARLADSMGGWVERGEAANTVITLLIMGVTALTVALAPLALEAALAAAPFVALYLVLQDFITFLRGGTSVIGDWANAIGGPGGADKLRTWLEDLWDKFKKFVSWITDKNTWQGFADSFKSVVDEITTYLNKKVRAALGDTASNYLGIPSGMPQGKGVGGTPSGAVAEPEWTNFGPFSVPTSMINSVSGAINGASNSVANWLMPSVADSRSGEMDPTLPEVDWAAAKQQMTGDVDWSALKTQMFGAVDWDAATKGAFAQPTVDSVYGNSMIRGQFGGVAPTINNNITVQGNATAQTAREIATQAGGATASALGRDRSAIGASMGMSR